MLVINNGSNTIDYYNKNANKFYNDTINVSFSEFQNSWVSYLPENAYILDFGCGSGRDSKAFIEKGYRVDAIDGSTEMCNLAEKLLRQKVQCIRFQDFRVANKYDGIWACASILHLDIDSLQVVLNNLKEALKRGGYLYTSFKYGEYSGFRNGRYFTDMTENRFTSLINLVGDMEIISMKISSDVRPEREDEKWINIILRKMI